MGAFDILYIISNTQLHQYNIQLSTAQISSAAKAHKSGTSVSASFLGKKHYHLYQGCQHVPFQPLPNIGVLYYSQHPHEPGMMS
jgi:hypothetical protein